ncbi:MAG: ribosomal RNA small subunit methyltransferase I [Cyclobacteriaceae bacterium]|nr:MAG: ribosomal RNA small subunit methyltransferase I [Cyclobacteriaceae bacterium]
MQFPTRLYLVPTPIGNLQDITLRALSVLKEVDTILAEDTRTSSKLLKHYQINNTLESFHSFNEHKKLIGLMERLKNGETMALISDAGTPSISDPGFLLVRSCHENQIPVECLPGPTALIPALVNSALPSDRFVFEGFLPPKKGRKTRLEEIKQESKTIILYESPHRLLKTLEQLSEVLGGERKASVSRELTKLHQETINGTLSELIDYYKKNTLKGELVIVIAGK